MYLKRVIDIYFRYIQSVALVNRIDRQTGMDSSSKREIWEEGQFDISISDDKPQFSASTEVAAIVEIVEEKMNSSP